MKKLAEVKKGLNCILGSVVILLILFFAMIGALAYTQGALTSRFLEIVSLVGLMAFVLAMVGKLLCLKSPVGQTLMQVAIGCDVVAFLLQLFDQNGALFTFVSFMLLLAFLIRLGHHIESTEVVSTGRKSGYGFGIGYGLLLLCIILPVQLQLLAAPLGMLSLLYGLLLYARTLSFSITHLEAVMSKQRVGGPADF